MREYSFLNVVLHINGVPITGFDEGDDVISLERTVDSASDKVGADGEMSVSISADRSGMVTFRLMQTSSSNSFLSELVSTQETGKLIPVSVLFKDVCGGDLGAGSKGYIPRPADIVRGQSVNSQEWKIKVERLNLLHEAAAV